MELLDELKDINTRVATAFADKYFGKDYELWFVCDDALIMPTVYINDHFFSMDDIVQFLYYKYSKKDMFEYTEKSLECARAELPKNMICRRDWRQINKMSLNKRVTS